MIRALVAALALLLVLGAGSATAQELKRPESLDAKPQLFQRTGNDVLKIAGNVPEIREEVASFKGKAKPEVFTKGPGRWQVSWFTDKPRTEVAQVAIDDASGAVLEAWTGYKVPWTMARGYDGAFARKMNAPYVWIPLALAFLLPLIDWRRPLRWFTLDLLVLTGFSLSYHFFNVGNVDTSVPLVYPLLVYLLVRMLVIGLRRDAPVDPPRILVPVSWLAIGIVFLVGFRIGLNVTDSNVIDVGYSGVIGADRLADGDPLYGDWPKDNEHGDTYGPVAYWVYLPFEQLLPWSGKWDDLPAAHGAAITFDLLTLLLVFLTGRRIGGTSLGVVAAYAWAAFPFSLFALNTNSNDALVAALVVLAVLVAGRPVLRGATGALAALSKFAPAAILPVLATHDLAGRPLREQAKRLALFVVSFAVVAAALLLVTVDDLKLMYERTIEFQSDRNAPFSVWGLYDWELGQKLVQGAAVILAVALALVPRRRDLAGLAALCAAVLIAVQLTTEYWFYLYVVWFFPLVMLALLAPRRSSAPSTA